MSRFMRIFQICTIVLCLVLPHQLVAQERTSVLVFAASSLSDVMGDLEMRFEAETGIDVVLSLGGSSLHARQIEAGAPADIFVSASRDWSAYLTEHGASKEGVVIARNRLAVLGREGVSAISNLSDLPAGDGIAVGDPDHVPAGIYARQAMEQAGVWNLLEPDLRRTANVRLAVVLAAIGAVDYAIGYASDAQADDRLSVKYLIPQSLHEPIEYFAGRMLAQNVLADRFLQFLSEDAARAVFAAHGFVGVDES